MQEHFIFGFEKVDSFVGKINHFKKEGELVATVNFLGQYQIGIANSDEIFIRKDSLVLSPQPRYTFYPLVKEHEPIEYSIFGALDLDYLKIDRLKPFALGNGAVAELFQVRGRGNYGRFNQQLSHQVGFLRVIKDLGMSDFAEFEDLKGKVITRLVNKIVPSVRKMTEGELSKTSFGLPHPKRTTGFLVNEMFKFRTERYLRDLINIGAIGERFGVIVNDADEETKRVIDVDEYAYDLIEYLEMDKNPEPIPTFTKE